MPGQSVPIISPQDALVAIMVTASVSDEAVGTSELVSIERIVNHMPVFSEYDMGRITEISTAIFKLMEDEDGLDALFEHVRKALPERLYETAYAMACDVVAADGVLNETEIRYLEEIRLELSISRLSATAIEHGARARHMTVPKAGS